MDEHTWLQAISKTNSGDLQELGHRMVMSNMQSDDSVQQVELRLSRTEPDEIENYSSWLTAYGQEKPPQER